MFNIERTNSIMKKIIIAFFIIVIFIGGGICLYNFNKTKKIQQGETNKNTTYYQTERSNTNINVKTNDNNNTDTTTVTKKETEIASFSTKIYNKDEERQNNIGITCKTLSAKEIQPGEIFSFCETVGKATISKGYKEADIYVNGKKEQGLGGGNCQVSTTLYNAVLQVPGLEVIERHQHSGHVPYVQEGKDAAVAYGNYDFKFKNNTENIIKIVIENTADNITARLFQI